MMKVPTDFWHVDGAKFVSYIQTFEVLDSIMLLTSRVASPYCAYSLAFPAAFYLHPTLGVTTMICAAFTEWLSGVLKFMLHGHRPYWWVGQYATQTATPAIHIRQFPITCETGPGSPSGHTMVTVATLMPLVGYLLRRSTGLQRRLLVACFVTFTAMLGISRCYVAAHFPHQVVAGLFAGLAFGWMFDQLGNAAMRSTPSDIAGDVVHSLQHCVDQFMQHPRRLVISGLLSFIAAWAVECSLRLVFKIDTNWALQLAISSCQNPSWVHMSTNLMICFARIAGYLTGMAVGLHVRNLNPKVPHLKSESLVQVFLLALLAHFSSNILEVGTQKGIYALVRPLVDLSDPTKVPGAAHLCSSFIEASIGPCLAVWWLPVWTRNCIGFWKRLRRHGMA